LNVSRRSVLIVVSVTTGVSVFVVNTPRPLVVVDVPLVSPRRNKVSFIFIKYTFVPVILTFVFSLLV
jgi:hypothetical protein